MKQLYMLLIFTLLLAPSLWADVHPGKMTAFDLSGFPLLRGFSFDERSKGSFNPPQDSLDRRFAAATWNAIYSKGPTRLNYGVILFPSRPAMEAWNKQQQINLASWVHELPSGNTSRTPSYWMEKGGDGEKGKPIIYSLRSVFVVNRVLIHVLGEPTSMVTESSQAAREGAQRFRLVDSIAKELAARAKRLPANQN